MKRLLEAVGNILEFVACVIIIVLIVNAFRYDAAKNGAKHVIKCTWDGGCEK